MYDLGNLGRVGAGLTMPQARNTTLCGAPGRRNVIRVDEHLDCDVEVHNMNILRREEVKRQRGNEAKKQRGEEAKAKTRKKERTAPLRVQWEKINNDFNSFCSSNPDFFLCGTIRHNQDDPQWIVAQRLFSALITPEVFKSSAKELSCQQARL